MNPLDVIIALLTVANDFVRPLTEALKPWTAVFSFFGAVLGATATAYGLLQRRITKRTKQAAEGAHRAAAAAETTGDETKVLVERLVNLLEKRQANHDELWGAYLKKESLTPERIAQIAREALEADLRPIQEALATWETDQHRHRRSEMPTALLELEGAAA